MIGTGTTEEAERSLSGAVFKMTILFTDVHGYIFLQYWAEEFNKFNDS